MLVDALLYGLGVYWVCIGCVLGVYVGCARIHVPPPHTHPLSTPPSPHQTPTPSHTLPIHCTQTLNPSYTPQHLPYTQDLDDALSVQQLPNGLLRVGVHIADVSHFVLPGTVLDDEASSRATSVYLVEKVIPMLPPLLCEQLCRCVCVCMWEVYGCCICLYHPTSPTQPPTQPPTHNPLHTQSQSRRTSSHLYNRI